MSERTHHDEQRLRDALEAAVPDPPSVPGRAGEARWKSRTDRRRHAATAAGVAAALVATFPVVHALDHDPAPSQVAGIVTQHAGVSACTQLTKGRHAFLADHRTVDASTAAQWLSAVGGPVDPGSLSTGESVTVCLVETKTTTQIAVTQRGRPPRVLQTVVNSRDYRSVFDTMRALDQVTTGGADTTDAPFECPKPGASTDQDVSSSLPSGATGALLCYDNVTLYSPRRILDSPGVEALLLAVDKAPLSYVPATFTCGGVADFRTYSLVFRYPSGIRTVSMEECRGLAVGQYTREPPTDLDARFEHWLLESGPVFADLPTCPAADAMPHGLGDLRHLVSARWCPSGSSGPGIRLRGRDLDALVRWGGSLEPATTSTDGPCRKPSAGWPHLALTDAWGNAFTTTVECQVGLISARATDASHRVVYPASGDLFPWRRAVHRLEGLPR